MQWLYIILNQNKKLEDLNINLSNLLYKLSCAHCFDFVSMRLCLNKAPVMI